MGKKSLSSTDVSQLRRVEETQRLIRELQARQIELEMQNEELKRVRRAAEEVLAQYVDRYNSAPVGYFTLDRNGTIRHVNLTGARLVGIERAQLLNRSFAFLISEANRSAFNTFLQKTFARKERGFCEVKLSRELPSPLLVRIEAVVSRDGRECRAAVLDVAGLHHAATERNQTIEKLQQSPARVTPLSGLLTVCACCKNIQDDEGYWTQFETYISSRSEATFTHGLCPECTAKLYPELYKPKEIGNGVVKKRTKRAIVPVKVKLK